MADVHLWLWTIIDPVSGKRRKLGYRMTEVSARERFGSDAQKVEGSLEVRQPTGSTSDYLRSKPKS